MVPSLHQHLSCLEAPLLFLDVVYIAIDKLRSDSVTTTPHSNDRPLKKATVCCKVMGFRQQGMKRSWYAAGDGGVRQGVSVLRGWVC